MTKPLNKENYLAFVKRYNLMLQICKGTGYYPPNVLIEAEHIDNLVQWLTDTMKKNKELEKRIEELEHGQQTISDDAGFDRS